MQDRLLMEIKVACGEAVRVTGKTRDIVMIPFTGEASGPYFTGKVIGTGVDTQRVGKDGVAALSARYMMEGTDCEGNACRVFVENQGIWGGRFTPVIVTDSPVMGAWESEELSATVEGIPGGVMVKIYKEN